MVTLMLSAILLWLCSLNLSHKKSWIIFPVLFLLWGNLHLGFIAGLAIFALFSIERAYQEKSKQPLYIWLACGAATWVNPYGPQLFVYFSNLANSPFMNKNIFELGSPAFNTQPLLLAYYMVILLAGFYAFRDARIRWADKAFYLIGFGLSLYSMRHIFLLILARMPMMAIAIEGLRKRLPGWPRALQAFSFSSFTVERERPWPWVLGMLIVGILFAQQKAYTLHFPQERNLSGVLSYVREHPLPGPLLSSELWGSYLIFFTQKRSYLDSRMDMYGDPWVKRMAGALSLEGNWRQVFQQYKFHYVMLPPTSLQFRYLHGYCQAKALYQDANAAILDVQSLPLQCQ
jgi:hypothetical protein